MKSVNQAMMNSAGASNIAAIQEKAQKVSLHILMAAYQCGPGMGSVSQIGWEWFLRTAQEHPVTLLTHVRNRPAIDAYGPLPSGAQIEWIDSEWFAGPLHRLAQRLFPRSEHAVFATSSLDFFVFDHLALRRAQALQRKGSSWRLVHVVTPVTTSAATRLHQLGLPLVRGPLNCGLQSPGGFKQHLAIDASWTSGVRHLTRALDALLGSSRHAARLIAGTRATVSEIGQRHAARTVLMAENAIDPDTFTAQPWPAGANEHLKLLFVGRLIAVKGLDMLLHALARANAEGLSASLQVLGDGPMRTQWEQLTHQLGLAQQVQFLGNAPRADVVQAMHDCHLLMLPSVRESGGGVLVEAMACGRPIVAVDWGGPAEIVNELVGRGIPATHPEAVTQDLLQAMRDCASDPAAWATKAIRAAQIARDHWSWNARLERMQAIYGQACAEHAGC